MLKQYLTLAASDATAALLLIASDAESVAYENCRVIFALLNAKLGIDAHETM